MLDSLFPRDYDAAGHCGTVQGACRDLSVFHVLFVNGDARHQRDAVAHGGQAVAGIHIFDAPGAGRGVGDFGEQLLLRMVKTLPLGCGKPKEITFQNPFRGKGDWLLRAGCGQVLRGENAESGGNNQIQQILAQLDVVQMV